LCLFVSNMVSSELPGRTVVNSLTLTLANRFAGNDREELLNELTSEFICFLLGNYIPKLETKPEQLAMVANGQVKAMLGFAIRGFFSKLQDDARAKDKNPQAYMYRRVREVVSSEDEFTVFHGGINKKSYISYSLAELDPVDRKDVFDGVSYGEWVLPPDPGQRDKLFSRKYIVELCRFFCRECREQFDGDYTIPVNEVVRFLTCYHGHLKIVQPESIHSDDDEDTRCKEPPSNDLLIEELVEQRESVLYVERLAVEATDLFDANSARVFIWRLDEDVSFKDIAKRLGMKDHNQPRRIFQKIIREITRIADNCPGLPLSELPREVGIAFIEAVKKNAQKIIS